MYGYIYKTTNLVNGKIYIGQHKATDFDTNYYGSGRILKNAIRKYGVSNFKVDVLCWVDTKKQADEKEVEYIELFNSRDRTVGYNIAYGGEGGDLVSCLSDEEYIHFCQTVSNANKLGLCGNRGKHLSDEHKLKIGQANRGKKHSVEWVNKQRAKVKGLPAWNKGLTADDERVQKYVHKKGEFHHTEASKLKISNSKKGRTPHIKDKDLWKQRLSDSRKGKPLKEEQAQRCRTIAVGRIWVYNEEHSKMIYPNELDEYINLGYKKGRGSIK